MSHSAWTAATNNLTVRLNPALQISYMFVPFVGPNTVPAVAGPELRLAWALAETSIQLELDQHLHNCMGGIDLERIDRYRALSKHYLALRGEITALKTINSTLLGQPIEAHLGHLIALLHDLSRDAFELAHKMIESDFLSWIGPLVPHPTRHLPATTQQNTPVVLIPREEEERG